MIKITEHFKERYAGRLLDLNDIEEALRTKPEIGKDGRLTYTGKKAVVITDSKTEYLITCYFNKEFKSKPLQKPKKIPCDNEGCKRKAIRYFSYCKKHFKAIKNKSIISN